LQQLREGHAICCIGDSYATPQTLRPPASAPALQDKTTFASQMQSTLNGDLSKALAKELRCTMKLGAGLEREQEAASSPLGPPGAHAGGGALEEQRQKSAAKQAMGNSAPRCVCVCGGGGELDTAGA
jgi:hypothetical protein